MADASTSSGSEGITLEGLKAHSTRDDLWLLINGKVYDVTKFMDEVSALPCVDLFGYRHPHPHTPPGVCMVLAYQEVGLGSVASC